MLISPSAVVVATAGATNPYHVHLEANSAAPFPYLGRLATATLHVYPHGVRANTIWLNGFSRNGSPNVTVMNPLARMYTDVPIREFPGFIARITGGESEMIESN